MDEEEEEEEEEEERASERASERDGSVVVVGREMGDIVRALLLPTIPRNALIQTTDI